MSKPRDDQKKPGGMDGLDDFSNLSTESLSNPIQEDDESINELLDKYRVGIQVVDKPTPRESDSEKELTTLLEELSADTEESVDDLNAYLEKMENYEGEDENEKAAVNILAEVSKTEQTFINKLTTDSEPILSKLQTNKNVTAAQKSKLAQYVDLSNQVKQTSSDVFTNIKSGADIGNISPDNFSNHLRNIVQLGMLSQELMMEQKNPKGQKTRFRIELEQAVKASGKSADSDPFIYAIQRMPRYELFVKDLQKQTDPDSKAGKKLTGFLNELQAHTTYLNAASALNQLLLDNKSLLGANHENLRKQIFDAVPNMETIKTLFFEKVFPLVDASKFDNKMNLESLGKTFAQLEEKNSSRQASTAKSSSASMDNTQSSAEEESSEKAAPKQAKPVPPPRPPVTAAPTKPIPAPRPPIATTAPVKPTPPPAPQTTAAIKPAIPKTHLSYKESRGNPTMPSLLRVKEHLQDAIAENKKAQPDLRKVAYHMAKVTGYIHIAEQANIKKFAENNQTHNLQTLGTRDLLNTIKVKAQQVNSSLTAKQAANPDAMKKTNFSFKERYNNPAGFSISEASHHLRAAIAENRKKNPNKVTANYHLDKAMAHLTKATAINKSQFEKRGVHTEQTFGTRDLLESLMNRAIAEQTKMQKGPEDKEISAPSSRRLR